MSSPWKDHFVTTALAACILGLVVCPYAYIAIGALRGLKSAALFGVLAPLFISSGFLLWRYLPKPVDPPKAKLDVLAILLIAMEVMSWPVLLAVLYYFMSVLGLPAVLDFSTIWDVLTGVDLKTILYLPTGVELPRKVVRVGTLALVFLCTSALCLPVVLRRDTKLERRLIRLPMDLLLAALVFILSVSGALIVADVLVSAKVGLDPRYHHTPG